MSLRSLSLKESTGLDLSHSKGQGLCWALSTISTGSSTSAAVPRRAKNWRRLLPFTETELANNATSSRFIHHSQQVHNLFSRRVYPRPSVCSAIRTSALTAAPATIPPRSLSVHVPGRVPRAQLAQQTSTNVKTTAACTVSALDGIDEYLRMLPWLDKSALR